MKTTTRDFYVAVLLILSLILVSSSSQNEENNNKWKIDGKVLELDDSNFESAISAFDYVLADFYAPWCGHCKRLNPQLDEAAPLLAELKEPIAIVKINADKYRRLADKYDVDGYPTLKIFIHGVPMEYYGPRKAELLVRYVKKFVAPDVAVLSSDSAIKEFVEVAGFYFPIYIGFGLDESTISNLAIKYKKKAWFAVAKDFSEDIMVWYDFDKVPTLVSLRPSYNEQSVFYGPFEEQFVEEFIQQNLFPLVVPINYDTLKSLKDDKRKIVLTIVEDEDEEKSKNLIKILKSAASANRDLLFANVGVKQYPEFVDSFDVSKKTKLPKIVVWDGIQEYSLVTGSEYIDEEDQGSQISRFLEGYREGKTVQKRLSGPSFMGFINSLIGIRSVYIIVFLVAIIMLIRSIGKIDDEDSPVRRRGEVDHGSQSAAVSQSREQKAGEKED